LLKSNETAKEVGTWISVGTSAVAVPARTSVTIPIHITVPEGATPGDHAGAVLASAPTVGIDDQGNQVNLDPRTGTRIYVRVKGAGNPSLVVENLSAKYHGAFNPLDGSLAVSY